MASIADLLGVQWGDGDNNPVGDYSLHPHAARQATQKGFDHKAVLAAANNPQHTSPNHRYPGQMRHVRDGLVAVVDPARKRVITAYKDQEETALRPDQKDPDAKKYGRTRGVGGAR